MPRCKRRYTWQVNHHDPLMPAEVAPRVRAVVAFWELPKYRNRGFEDATVTGEHLGTLLVSVTVKGRDRWACSTLANEFAVAVATAARVRLAHVDKASAKRLPPHTNRGYRRVANRDPSTA